MKKYLLLASLLLLFTGIRAQDGAPFPPVNLTDIFSNAFTTQHLQKGKPVIVFYFDPDCDHCQQQAEWMKESMADFKNVNLLWISWGELPAIQQFAKKYFADYIGYPVFFTKDHGYKMDQWFGESLVPSIYVYNAQWSRIASFKNEMHPSELKTILTK